LYFNNFPIFNKKRKELTEIHLKTCNRKKLGKS
jgi:hypothetical protein